MLELLNQSQIIFIVAAMATSAIAVGFMAGLFGIGGGLITVPVLFYIFGYVGMEQTFIMQYANPIEWEKLASSGGSKFLSLNSALRDSVILKIV